MKQIITGRLAAYYNQICMGTSYPIDTVREVKKYIHNKNTYLNSEIDEYYGTAEPPVRCGESHLSGLTEPPHFVY